MTDPELARVTVQALLPPSATVYASPNPCTLVTSGSNCASAIAWNSSSAPNAGLFFGSTLVGGTPSGTYTPNWINVYGYSFDVRLDRNNSSSQILASVFVSGVVAPPPANLQTQCSADGTSVTVWWSPVAGATGYAPRLNYVPNDGPGCTDGWICSALDKYGNQTATSYTTSIVPGSPYNFWVHANFNGTYGNASSIAFTCAVPNEPFPPFTSYRSDFLDLLEGSSTAHPLKVATTQCPIANESLHPWMCPYFPSSFPRTFTAANSFSNTPDPYFSWIIVRNDEEISDTASDTGPPNQSRALNGDPFSLAATAASLKLMITRTASSTPGKLPYMSAAYLRGVQAGDPKARLYNWQQLQGKKVVLNVDLSRANDNLVWFRVLTHFRNPATGERYFVNRDYVTCTATTSPCTLAALRINWNWPFQSSLHYPGAIIAITARDPSKNISGLQALTINLATDAANNFTPYGINFNTMQPDFLGVEVAIEMGGVVNSTSAEIKSISFQ